MSSFQSASNSDAEFRLFTHAEHCKNGIIPRTSDNLNFRQAGLNGRLPNSDFVFRQNLDHSGAFLVYSAIKNVKQVWFMSVASRNSGFHFLFSGVFFSVPISGFLFPGKKFSSDFRFPGLGLGVP